MPEKLSSGQPETEFLTEVVPVGQESAEAKRLLDIRNQMQHIESIRRKVVQQNTDYKIGWAACHGYNGGTTQRAKETPSVDE